MNPMNGFQISTIRRSRGPATGALIATVLLLAVAIAGAQQPPRPALPGGQMVVEGFAAERGQLQDAPAGLAAGADKAISTVFADDFESGFPGTAWTVSTNGDAFWDDWTCWASSGQTSVGGAAGGSSGIPCGGFYPTGYGTWMVAGPFSLADPQILAAELQAAVNINTEDEYDGLLIGVSLDGLQYYGAFYDGSYTGQAVIDLSDVFTLGNVIGEDEVWIGFRFTSDGSITFANGAQVDDVEILVETSGGGPGGANTLGIGTANGTSGTVVTVPLTLSNEDLVKGLQLDVLFDPLLATFAGVAASGRGLGMQVDGAQTVAGRARIVAFHDGPGVVDAGAGEIAQLSFNLLGPGGNATALTAADPLLAGPEAQALAVTATDGSIGIAPSNDAPSLQLSVLRNPGRVRSLQVLVAVTNGSGAAPTVEVAGAAVPITPLGGGLYLGNYHASDGMVSVAVTASDTNANGTGNALVSVTFP
jgi:hypothetical protein